MTAPLRDDPLLSAVPEVDGYKVLEPCVLYSKIGEGGMGAVYKGRHANLDIDVAVKCLRQLLADRSEDFVERFQREARIAAGIHHQNLVQVYDVSHRSGVHYLVMEYVSGETARDRVSRKGPLAVDEALRITLGAALGLAEAHSKRIVHRDVKPDNILVSREGRVKVSDLGLAKALENEKDAGLTQGVMGTPQYMAPEQWEDSAQVLPAVDVWSLGATLYFLLTAVDPIAPGSMSVMYRRVCVDPFPDVRKVRKDVPSKVVQLLERCVARQVDKRFADCSEVVRELEKLVDREIAPLADDLLEDTRPGPLLVSPPPPATLARVKMRTDGLSAELGGDTLVQPTERTKEASPARSRASRYWIAGASLAVFVALAGYFGTGILRSEMAHAGGSERGDEPIARDEDVLLETRPQAAAIMPAEMRSPNESGASVVVAPEFAPRTGTRAPKGCLPDGDDTLTLTIEGKTELWAKRVRMPESGLVLALVPPGRFVMGSETGAKDARPAREVEIRRPFYIGVHEVSAAQWAQLMGGAPPPAEAALLPARRLSWRQALDFCSRCDGRLPTEAEWEYACRADSTSAFHFGDTATSLVAATLDSRTGLRPCGSFEPNAWGLHDMHGNVMEWCQDVYSPTAYYDAVSVDPLVTGPGDQRVMRGGSYNSGNAFCTSWARHAAGELQRTDSTGLRIVRDLD